MIWQSAQVLQEPRERRASLPTAQKAGLRCCAIACGRSRSKALSMCASKSIEVASIAVVEGSGFVVLIGSSYIGGSAPFSREVDPAQGSQLRTIL
jgi:hypothetical protein